MTDGFVDVAPDSVLENDGLDRTRPCPRPTCTGFVPLGAPGNRTLCDLHKAEQDKKRGKRQKAPKGERPDVHVHLGSPAPRTSSKDKAVLEVTAGAHAMLSVIVTGVAMADPVCGKAWDDALPRLAAQIGELAKFHPGMVKFFAPVGEDSEFAAWLGLGLAMGPPVIATLSHHNVLPDALAAKVVGVAVAATEVVPDGAAAA